MGKHSSWNRRRVLSTVGSATLTPSVAGCLFRDEIDENAQNEGTNDYDPEETGPVSQATVAMLTDESGHHFDPPLVWIETGGTVTWMNRSGSHTTTAYHTEFGKPIRIPVEAEPWDSGMFTEEGASFDWTFAIEGVYDYFCVPHDYRAMVGTVIVGDPDPHNQPALDEPQDELPEEAREFLATLTDRTAELLGDTTADP